MNMPKHLVAAAAVCRKASQARRGQLEPIPDEALNVFHSAS